MTSKLGSRSAGDRFPMFHQRSVEINWLTASLAVPIHPPCQVLTRVNVSFMNGKAKFTPCGSRADRITLADSDKELVTRKEDNQPVQSEASFKKLANYMILTLTN